MRVPGRQSGSSCLLDESKGACVATGSRLTGGSPPVSIKNDQKQFESFGGYIMLALVDVIRCKVQDIGIELSNIRSSIQCVVPLHTSASIDVEGRSALNMVRRLDSGLVRGHSGFGDTPYQ